MTSFHSIALRCDIHGIITEIISSTIIGDDCIQIGMPLARLASPGGLNKALSFLNEVRSRGKVFDWEINVALGEKFTTLHCSGIQSGDSLIIVGAESNGYSGAILEDLVRMNNEHINALRGMWQNSPSNTQFDEISRLNNDLVTMQRELAQKNAQLMQLNLEKNKFMGMAAHDLRNPLYAILAASEYLLFTAADQNEQLTREFLEVIFSSSRFMSALVDDLLDISKIEAGQLNLDYAMVDLVKLTERLIFRQRALAAPKNVSIDLISEPLPKAEVDAVKIEQVLSNLLSNALKFSPPGGKIIVNLGCDAEHFLLSVKDEGKGIPAADQAHLFTPFQSKGLGTQGEKGTGLGLTIVKRIVEGHGGRIWLESQEGNGATFFISIPLMVKGQ